MELTQKIEVQRVPSLKSVDSFSDEKDQIQKQHEEEAMKILSQTNQIQMKERERSATGINVSVSWDNINLVEPLPVVAEKLVDEAIRIEFVKENFSENFNVIAKKAFQKVWTFRNIGNKTIPPRSLKLCFESGHQFQQPNGMISET
jgi:hypothetical protein